MPLKETSCTLLSVFVLDLRCMKNYYFQVNAWALRWSVLRLLHNTSSEWISLWIIGGDWSVQLLLGRVVLLLWHFGVGSGGREGGEGILLPFWVMGSENKQSCLYFGQKWISIGMSLSLVLIDKTASCLVLTLFCSPWQSHFQYNTCVCSTYWFPFHTCAILLVTCHMYCLNPNFWECCEEERLWLGKPVACRLGYLESGWISWDLLRVNRLYV